MKLFEDDFGTNECEKDDTEIGMVILYFSKEETKEFKKNCKAGIKKMLGQELAIKQGNISDLLLKLTKEYAEPQS